MADFWIVSRKKFKQHHTFGAANAERERLQWEADQHITYRIYRCKTAMTAGKKFDQMEALLREAVGSLASSVWTPDWKARAEEFLRSLDEQRAPKQAAQALEIVQAAE